MTDMQLKQVQISLNAPIGQLGEVRKSHVLQALGAPFTNQPAPIPGFAAYVDPLHRRSVMLAEHQIIFIHEGENISPDLRDAERILVRTRDALLLDDRFVAGIQWIAHHEAEGAATELSVERFLRLSASEVRALFEEGLRGIGLRFTYESPPFTCDLRIEPFYADTAFFFIQFNAAHPQPLSLETILLRAAEFGEYVRDEAEEVLASLLQG
jgi:hypothetical protein